MPAKYVRTRLTRLSSGCAGSGSLERRQRVLCQARYASSMQASEQKRTPQLGHSQWKPARVAQQSPCGSTMLASLASLDLRILCSSLDCICLKARLLIINDHNNAPPLHVFLRRLKGFHAKVAAPIAVVRVPTKLQIDAGLNTYVISAEDSFPSSGYSVYTVSDGKIQNLCV